MARPDSPTGGTYDAPVFDHLPRARLATLPTPLERGPLLAGDVRLWVKRDDLTGLGMGGNKARKLEFLCGAAIDAGARSLVTVGASQSNHCRMTAAAGAVLGLDVHLVLSGDRPEAPTGNQVLSVLFGAQLHWTGAEESHWGELEIAGEALTDELAASGAAPFAIPIGGSTAIGAIGYAVAFLELMKQCDRAGIAPTAVVHTSSSGGTHAGLVAGRAIWRERGHAVPDVLAIGVAKGVTMGWPDVTELAAETIDLVGAPGAKVEPGDVAIDPNWLGVDYAIPTAEGDAAIGWAARTGGWLLDRVYSGKGMAGLLGNVEQRRWPPASDVVFIHTGGMPALFTPGGTPPIA
jgi:1-aminocyclopropane-1-carboxylate deaminase/D-cysteine desulfhydrase-like pyridoxal-dependent ACC family enzyme